jgi:adenylate cyclase
MASKTQSKKATQRKLTAILSADVVGYSRLMGADEESTIETLTAYRKVFTSEIKNHRGRVVDAKGDAILAECASVVDAVNGAVEIQRELAERNAELPDDRRMDFRIGINLGDVVVKDDVIYGDGVNVAARLESLAEPGGICISRSAHEQVKNKLRLEYEYLGEQHVKNIAEPVRAYKVLLESKAHAQNDGNAGRATPGQASSSDRPERPSIAVLPFDNLTADPGQEFFADGLVEEILTSLSKVSSMTVIARNSTFAYKGKSVDVRQVAQELGVRYVVEGSVRQGGNRLRITAQLIDSTDGSHVWAERYDRGVEDIFDIQDEITKEIVTALRINLSDSEKALHLSRGTNNVQAWGYCVQALELFEEFNPVDHAKAREFAKQALQLDPDYPMACAILGLTHWFDSRAEFSGDSQEALSLAAELAEKSLALDPENPYAITLSAFFQVSSRNFDAAIASARRGVTLNPGSAQARHAYAFTLLNGGRPEEAIPVQKDGIRLNPRYPNAYASLLARALDVTGQSKEAMDLIKMVLTRNSSHFSALLLRAAILSRESRTAEANEAIADLARFHPSFRLAYVDGYLLMRDQDYVDSITEALRKAGLPE